ncbi:MAG TPA: hypothetical protein VIV06_08790 [Candidatus Limnocylindrales bacterium]
MPERRPRLRAALARSSPRPTRSRRAPSAILAAVLAAVLTAGIAPPRTSAGEPTGLDRFLWALGLVESGGRYDAENSTSGAFGKYQILPSNWPAWAGRYLGDRGAPPTPRNQERVARGRILDLYESLLDWPAVAHWWLTGRTLPSTEWSIRAVRYVARIMELFGGDVGADALLDPSISVTFQEGSATVAYSGSWRSAGHGQYSHGRVRYSGTPGAEATFVFVGTAVAWYGPVGPTRGKARVYLDGRAVKTVDLRRPAFRASLPLFRRSWTEAERHTLVIEVLPTSGQRLVAIDRFVVRR